jgi:hypothetical protein
VGLGEMYRNARSWVAMYIRGIPCICPTVLIYTCVWGALCCLLTLGGEGSVALCGSSCHSLSHFGPPPSDAAFLAVPTIAMCSYMLHAAVSVVLCYSMCVMMYLSLFAYNSHVSDMATTCLFHWQWVQVLHTLAHHSQLQ